MISEVLNASLSIATPATNVRIFPTLAITWPQSAEGSESSWAHEIEGGKSGVWQGWNVLSALSGNLSGWRIDSTDKSTSRSGQ